ncbi:MAG: hypothetical protein IKE85_00410 [Mogibacterium sp.]|nr:hypothetical protein [Mogibacterium sp.]MBR2539277.1 hypothetical protein [Mogibacterium sp.]
MNTDNGTRSSGSAGGAGTGRMDFKRITLSIHGTMAWSVDYEIVKTAGGAEASHYEGDWLYNKLTSRRSCRKAHRKLSQAEYDELAKLFFEINVPSWNGKSWNDPNVMDGSSFSLDGELADGSLVFASGTNEYPDNYGTFKQAMYDAAYGK